MKKRRWPFIPPQVGILIFCALMEGHSYADSIATVDAVQPASPGSVDIQRNRSPVMVTTPHARGTLLYPGDVVGTRGSSKALIRYSGEPPVVIGPDSGLKIREAAPGLLYKGSLWTRIRGPRTIGSPSGTIRTRPGLRGASLSRRRSTLICAETPADPLEEESETELELQVAADGTTTVSVLAGAVDFTNASVTVDVNAGERSSAHPGQPPTKSVTISAGDNVAEWALSLDRAPISIPKRFQSLEGDALHDEIERLRKRADAAPSDGAVRIQLGDGLFDDGQSLAALDEYSKAERFGVESLAIRIGYALLGSDRLDEAAQRFNAALPDSEAEIGLAWVEMRQNRTEKAEALAKKAYDENPASAEAQLTLGLTQLRRPGELQDAVTTLERPVIESSKPYAVQAKSWLAMAYLAENRNDEALRAASSAVAMDPDSALAHGMLSQAHFYAGRKSDAWREAMRATLLDPKSVAAHLALGQADWARGDIDDASSEAQKAVLLDPSVPESWYLWGVINGQRLDYRRSLDELNQCLKIAPDFLPAAREWARTALAMGYKKRAARRIEEIAERYPQSHEVMASLGDARYDQGEYRDSIDAFRKAIALKPDAASYHYGLARVLLDANRLGEASEEARAAIQLEPQIAPYHAMLGRIDLYSGLQTQAAREFHIALSLDPQNALALALLAIVAQPTDTRIAATSFYQSYLLDPAITRQLMLGGINTELSANAGNRNYLEGSLNQRGIGDEGRLHYLASADGFQSDADHSDAKNSGEQVGLKATYIADPSTNLFVNGTYRWTKTALPGADGSIGSRDDQSKDNVGQTLLSLRSREKTGNSLWMGLFFDNDRNPSDYGAFPAATLKGASYDSIHDLSHRRFIAPEIRYDSLVNRDAEHPGVFSVGLAQADGQFTRDTVLQPNATTPYSQTLTNVLSDHTLLAYAQFSQQLNRRLSIVAQERAQRVSTNNQMKLLHNGATTKLSNLQTERWLSLPSLVTTYQADRSTLLRLTANKQSPAPLPSVFASTATLLTAETGVLPASLPDQMDLYQFDIERYLRKGAIAKLYVFHAYAKDLQIGGYSLPSANPPSLALTNWKSSGFGLNYDRPLARTVFLNVGLTARETKAKAPNEIYDDRMSPYDPSVMGTLGLHYYGRDGLKLGAVWRYDSGFYQDMSGEAGRPRFPAKQYVDLSIGFEPNINHEFFFSVTNVFNEKSILFQGFPTDQRQGIIGYDYRL